MQAIGRDFKAAQDSYCEDVLNLTLAKGYIKKRLDNARVVKFS